MSQKKNRILRFAVTGALLIGAPAMACGGGAESTHSNEPMPEHTSNEPMAEDTDDTMGDDMGGMDDDIGDDTPVEERVNEIQPE